MSYSEFFDLERGRQTQCKAFELEGKYYVGDKVEAVEDYRTYYVETLSYGYYIRVEGLVFTGIVRYDEDMIMSYPIFTCGGVRKYYTNMEEELVRRLVAIYKAFEECNLEKYKNILMSVSHLKYHVVDKIREIARWK